MAFEFDDNVTDEEKGVLRECIREYRELITDVIDQYWAPGRRPNLFKEQVARFFGSDMDFSSLRDKLEKIKKYDEQNRVVLSTSYSSVDAMAFQAAEVPLHTRIAETRENLILFYPRFFSRCNEEEKALTLFHELTHLVISTEDFHITATNTISEVEKFAREDSENACRCAHSFELFLKNALILPEPSDKDRNKQLYRVGRLNFPAGFKRGFFSPGAVRRIKTAEGCRKITEYFKPA